LGYTELPYTPVFLENNMKIFLKFLCLAVFFFVFTACATRTPNLVTFAAEGGTQYFFPMMEWQGGDKKEIGAVCDITYRYQSGSQGVYNISFRYTAKEAKGKVPSVPAALSLEGDGTAYPLSGIERLYANTETGVTRISSRIEGEDLLSVLRSQSITLIAAIDGAEYRFSPPKQFLEYRDKFLVDIAVQDFE
jgi:hypothetical protein